MNLNKLYMEVKIYGSPETKWDILNLLDALIRSGATFETCPTCGIVMKVKTPCPCSCPCCGVDAERDSCAF